MFFFLSKTAYFLFMPLGWILILWILSMFLRNPTWKKHLRIAAFVMLVFFSNPFFANEVIGWWERSPREFSSLRPAYDYGVILTGVADNTRQPNDRVYFNKGADRVTHSVQLYKMGKLRKVLVSGGTGAFRTPPILESDNLKRALVMMGVPDSSILIENRSKNTYQSAINSKEIIKEPEASLLLVTSGFHMRRAEACFRKAGFNVDTFPADFHHSPRSFAPNVWIPNPGAIQKWTIVFHEILGMLAYRIMGYI